MGSLVTALRFDATVRRGGFEVIAEFEIAAGDKAAIVGPNGAGKSTILSTIAGLIPVDEGELEIGGVTVDDPARNLFVPSKDRRLGFVFQDHLLFPNMSVLDNVAFGLRSRGVSKSDARAVAMDLLRDDALESLAARRPTQLSGGQAQRVALARAIATDPDVLLLDEPMSALDVESRADVRARLSRYLEAFTGAVVMVTHDPADASLLADRLIVIEGGSVVQTGTPRQVRRNPASAYVASFAGLNHLRANVEGGLITVPGTSESLQTADRSISGPALVTIAPSAVALHRDRPAGSPRNVWSTQIVGVEELGDVRRVILGEPFEFAADLTPGAVEAMTLAEGQQIWASVKATEVGVGVLK